MRKLFYPKVGETVRIEGTMRKGKVLKISKSGHLFYVRFGVDRFEWVPIGQIGRPLHDRLKVFRPLVDDEQTVTDWVNQRPMGVRKLVAFLAVIIVTVVSCIIWRGIMSWCG
jgi:hypothetical protein